MAAPCSATGRATDKPPSPLALAARHLQQRRAAGELAEADGTRHCGQLPGGMAAFMLVVVATTHGLV